MSTPVQHDLRLRGDGLDLRADVFGPASGQPLLFFHGGGQSRRAWSGVARNFGEAGYRAFTFDLRGHGDSEWAADGDYSLDAYARDVENVIDAFATPVVLIGASRGGQAALIGASRRPERVKLLLLADVAPGLRDEGLNEFRNFFRESAKGFGSVEEAAATLAQHFPLHAEKQRSKSASALMKTMRHGDDGRLYWKWDPQTMAPRFLNPPADGEAVERAAARLQCPVLLVRAEHSSIVTDDSVEKFRALTPHLELVTALGVGHMFTGDKNDAFARSLRERLAKL